MDGRRRLPGVRRDWEPTRRSEQLMALAYERVVPVPRRLATERPRPAAKAKGVPA